MRNVRFLVVDDSAMMRKLVASVIRTKIGSDSILMASDGREALNLLEGNEVDIIVSDWNMTDMDGDELLYAVRHHERYKNTPFVMVTTNNQRDFIITALQLGVTQYVVKPFTPADLEHKIRSSWTAANKRRSERHADLPKHRGALQVGETRRAATAINVSRNGLLVRVRYDPQIALYNHYLISLRFESAEQGKSWALNELRGHAVRLEAEEEKEYCLVALEFDANELPRDTAEELFALLEFLSGRTPTVIDG